MLKYWLSTLVFESLRMLKKEMMTEVGCDNFYIVSFFFFGLYIYNYDEQETDLVHKIFFVPVRDRK